MSSLSTQSYKGTRDYYPEDKRLQNYIFNTWRKVVESFGYEEYGAPILEPLEIYSAKSGQELVDEQTYTFQDRGGRTVTIRPEMTPTLSRMVAARRQELAMPSRLYSIANYMRYERPQRGREREFWQLNADLFGIDGEWADAEIIEMAHATMMAFGATESMFKIKVNNRDLISLLMHKFLGLDVVGAEMMIRLLDKKNKLSPDDFSKRAAEIFGDQSSVGLPKLAELIDIKKLDQMPVSLNDEPSIISLRNLLRVLNRKGVKNVEFDITLMRGFDYYTGTVFEFYDNDPENNRSLFGGGRYDGLVGLFGAEPVATVGVGLGASPMEYFLSSHELIPNLYTHTDVYIIAINSESLEGADELARTLRAEGVHVELDVTDRKLDKQIKTALKKQIPFVTFVGEEELSSGVYNVKNLRESSEQKVDSLRMISLAKDYRYDGDDDAIFSV